MNIERFFLINVTVFVEKNWSVTAIVSIDIILLYEVGILLDRAILDSKLDSGCGAFYLASVLEICVRRFFLSWG